MAELATIRETTKRCKDENLGVSETALRRWVAEGRLPVIQVGNRRLIFYPALLEFLAHGDDTDRSRSGIVLK